MAKVDNNFEKNNKLRFFLAALAVLKAEERKLILESAVFKELFEKWSAEAADKRAAQGEAAFAAMCELIAAEIKAIQAAFADWLKKANSNPLTPEQHQAVANLMQALDQMNAFYTAKAEFEAADVSDKVAAVDASIAALEQKAANVVAAVSPSEKKALQGEADAVVEQIQKVRKDLVHWQEIFKPFDRPAMLASDIESWVVDTVSQASVAIPEDFRPVSEARDSSVSIFTPTMRPTTTPYHTRPVPGAGRVLSKKEQYLVECMMGYESERDIVIQALRTLHGQLDAQEQRMNTVCYSLGFAPRFTLVSKLDSRSAGQSCAFFSLEKPDSLKANDNLMRYILGH